jgi:FAD/FMN-containing dehydrogenase
VTSIDALVAALGPDIVSIDASDIDSHSRDWQTDPSAAIRPAAVIRPRDTFQTAAAVRFCDAHRIPLTPQGGLTGLAGGAVPADGGIALSLERMNRIVEIDPVGATMIVECGTTLQRVQEAAAAQGMFFPLDLGARGSCQIGGNIGTNAGGNRVLRYGMMRDLVLGLEVVLADGTIVSAMNRMLKNNAGLDLRGLFVGSEGTLGVVTRAVLRLFDQPEARHTALCLVPDYAAAGRVLRLSRARLGATLTAYELMWPSFFEFACKVRGRRPFGAAGGFCLLIEASGSQRDGELLQSVLEDALHAEIATDCLIAQSLNDATEFWSLRDASGELRSHFWPNANFDVSAPTGRLGELAEELERRAGQRWPDVAMLVFGHIADGNIHISLKTDETPFPLQEIEEMVYGIVGEFDGSISAEHGIGLAKKAYLHHSRSQEEIALMRRIKDALDPHGLLNPDKVVPDR